MLPLPRPDARVVVLEHEHVRLGETAAIVTLLRGQGTGVLAVAEHPDHAKRRSQASEFGVDHRFTALASARIVAAQQHQVGPERVDPVHQAPHACGAEQVTGVDVGYEDDTRPVKLGRKIRTRHDRAVDEQQLCLDQGPDEHREQHGNDRERGHEQSAQDGASPRSRRSCGPDSEVVGRCHRSLAWAWASTDLAPRLSSMAWISGGAKKRMGAVTLPAPRVTSTGTPHSSSHPPL